MNARRKRDTRSRLTNQPLDSAAHHDGVKLSARRRIVRLGGLILVAAMGSLALWIGSFRAARIETPSIEPAPQLGRLDETKIRQICSHCHQLPSPDALPRSAWKETVWQMFQASGYGTTVKWQVDPEVVIAWYERRAPERFTFELGSETSDSEKSLPMVRRAIFAPAATDPVVSNILVEDLLGDARPELIVCDMLNGQILMGRTAAADWKFELLARTANPAHVEATDLDGDGRTDLLVANLGSYLALDHNLGSVECLLQSENGTFERQPLVEGLGRVADVQPEDFDGDGDLDVIVAEFGWRATGHLLLLENCTPPGSRLRFESREIDGLHGASHVDVADLDGDGVRDIVVLYSQGHEMVRSYARREQFAFSVHDVYRAPNPAWGFSGSQLMDFDGDGDLDVLLSNGDTFDNSILKPYHGIQWLENKGHFEFEPHQVGTLYGVYRAEAADMDGDGDLDVVACALIAPDAQSVIPRDANLDSIVWFEQTSAGRFDRHVLESGQCHHPTLLLSDYDLDGDVDLLVGNGQLHFTAVPKGTSCIDLWENHLAPGVDSR